MYFHITEVPSHSRNFTNIGREGREGGTKGITKLIQECRAQDKRFKMLGHFVRSTIF